MAKPLPRRRRLNLRRELHKIHGAVEAARILSEAVATGQLGPERDHRRAPRAIASLLVLVGERLQVLRRAARPRGAPQEGPAEGAGGPGPRSADERVLKICARQQRAGGLAPGGRRAA
jgi:hypothetical protein